MEPDEAFRQGAIHAQLVYLLTRQNWEDNNMSVAKQLGRLLLEARVRNRWGIAEVARKIGVSMTVIEGIERADNARRGATFEAYERYMHLVGFNWIDLFEQAASIGDTLKSYNQIQYESLRQNVEDAIDCLTARGEPVSHRRVADQARISRRTICKHPELQELIRNAKNSF